MPAPPVCSPTVSVQVLPYTKRAILYDFAHARLSVGASAGRGLRAVNWPEMALKAARAEEMEVKSSKQISGERKRIGCWWCYEYMKRATQSA